MWQLLKTGALNYLLFVLEYNLLPYAGEAVIICLSGTKVKQLHFVEEWSYILLKQLAQRLPL